MAEVIKGVFPEMKKSEEKKDGKPIKPMPSYILHISVAFSDPPIWRRIQVPGDYTLARLHDVIQQSMGWSDSHVHQFLVGKISYEPTMKSTVIREAKRFDEHLYRLSTLEEGMQFMFTYLYGAGEGWEHEIILEEVVPPTRELSHPIVMAGEGACPPESVGDIHEYQSLLAARQNPGGKNRNRLDDLVGRPDFDPAFFDLEAAKKRVAALAPWSVST
jgi:hypothetical protein